MSGFSAKINDHIAVRNGTLFLDDKPFDGHEIMEELGRGANGVVFRAKNNLLNRSEAIKVWFAAREGDKRDKVQQGVAEAMKLAAAGGRHAVQIFSAKIEGRSVVATMECIEGETLKSYCGKMRDIGHLLGVGYKYLEIMETTTTPETRHGDPHWKNVLVYKDSVSKYEELLGMKLCDFGTSAFAGKESSERRHWLIVNETIMNITRDFPDREAAVAQLGEWRRDTESWLAKNERKSDHLSHHDIARMHTAPLRDYLDIWRMHRYPPENQQNS